MEKIENYTGRTKNNTDHIKYKDHAKITEDKNNGHEANYKDHARILEGKITRTAMN